MLAWTKQNTMQNGQYKITWGGGGGGLNPVLRVPNGGAGGGLIRFYGYRTPPSTSIMAQNIQLFGPREGFLTHQWIITGNK